MIRRDQSDENHMVLPFADDDAVVCTCIDYEAGDADPHCPAHVHYDTWEIYDDARQRRIDDEKEDE